MTITFTVLVDRTSAAALNIGTDRIEDILILHLENGKDFFISISGSFQPTCFSMPLALLVRMPEPVRLSRDIIERWSTVEARKEMEAVLSVPKEVWRLVDHLFQHGLKTVGGYVK